VVKDKAKEASAKVKSGDGWGKSDFWQGSKVGMFAMANKLFFIQNSSVTSGKIPGN
jgi:hypothetical protein